MVAGFVPSQAGPVEADVLKFYLNTSTNSITGRDSFLSEAPLAFQVVLAGLSPVSMDLDWSVGGSMTSVAASSWDAAALSLVRRIVTDSGGEAEMVDTVVDPRGRRHGQLLIITRLSKGEVNSFSLFISSLSFIFHHLLI